jgi:hypothetical protein
MKVYKNDPIFESDRTNDGEYVAASRSNMPLRLEIAARILAARESDSNDRFSEVAVPNKMTKEVQLCLRLADALIDAHNATAGEGAQ